VVGDFAAEPQGLKGVVITPEELAFDLRPLASLEPAHVEAVYHLDNPGPARKLDLLFVAAGAGVNGFQVSLNGSPVASREVPLEGQPGQSEKLPESWKPPRQFPGIDRTTYPHTTELDSTLTTLAFAVELPPGRSKVAARYRVRACGTDESYPTATWQVPYVLAPAKAWGGFGGLDVVVHLPDGWEASATPALARDGDVLRGHFEGLPADWLAVAARKPVGPELGRAAYGCVALYAAAVAAGGVFCWWVGWWQLGSVARSPAAGGFLGCRLFLAGILAALFWVGLVYGACLLATQGVFATLGGQESPYFHEHFFVPLCGNFLLVVLILPAGYAITVVSACSARGPEGR
jgi:hypothetical protein